MKNYTELEDFSTEELEEIIKEIEEQDFKTKNHDKIISQLREQIEYNNLLQVITDEEYDSFIIDSDPNLFNSF